MDTNDVIDERLLEVSLTIKSWGGVKRDPKQEQKIREASGATRKVGHFDKYLVSKDVLHTIKTIDGAWRNRNTELTLPWSDTTRVVTVAGFKKWAAEMRDSGHRRQVAVDKFCDNWPALVEQAKQELNGEFDPDTYPSADEVRTRFVAEGDYFAVRRGKHLAQSKLVEQLGDMLDERQAEVEERAMQRVADAVAEVTGRIVETLEHFSERMHGYKEIPNPEYGKKKRAQPTVKVGTFKENTVAGLRDMVTVLEGLNIYDDPRIAEVLADVDKHLTGKGTPEAYAQQLRDDDALRAKVADKTDKILKKMSAF